jgi:pyrroloquinoline quinone (PQQ) biosynthesis protein C
VTDSPRGGTISIVPPSLLSGPESLRRSLERPLARRLLAVMDRKHHWAYPALTRPGLSRAQLLEHFRHEYLVYVRDFPVMVAAALAQVPPLGDVRGALAENIYEEQTGAISQTAPHPELFLRMMEGLGLQRDEVADETKLHPAAVAYRTELRERAARPPWQAAVALMTIFVEGSVHERAELEGSYVRPRGEEAVARHALVVHYGCPPSAMTLTRAHAAVEGGHRADAWRIVLSHVDDDGPIADAVGETCERALAAWLVYRDGVAARIGLSAPPSPPDAASS